MKKNLLCLALCLLTVAGSFAQPQEEIPEWMKNSYILMSEYAYGEQKCVGDLFFVNELATTQTTMDVVDGKLIITNEMGSDDFVIVKSTTTFVMQKIGNAGTCYISNLVFESPLTFQTERFSCSNPYNDPKSYGEIMGALQELLLFFYEE